MARHYFSNQDNPGAARRRRLWAALEAEFGEPVADIITGLREQGNSWRTVAGALGVNRSTLQEWRRALKLPVEKNSKQFDPSSRALSPHEQRARAMGYESFAAAVTALRLQGKTLRQAADLFGVHWQTVSTHTLPEAKGVYNRTAYWYQQRRRWAKEMAKRARFARRHKAHPWKQDNDHAFRP